MRLNKETASLVISSLLGIIAALCILLPLLGMLGKIHWTLDIFSHFRVQYVAALFLCGVLFFLLKRKKCCLVCLSAGVLFSMPYVHYFVPAPIPEKAEAIKFISFNVLKKNSNHDAVRKFLKSENADVIFLMEIDTQWLEDLKDLKISHPYQITYPQNNNFGMALLSKYPFDSAQFQFFGSFRLAYAEATLRIRQKDYHLFGVHTMPPVDGYASMERNGELLEIMQKVSKSTASNILVLGDFNLSPFSPHFSELLEISGLKDTAVGFGIFPTWQRNFPPVTIPIDHILISEDIQLQDRRVHGDNLGSDHNPVIVTLN